MQRIWAKLAIAIAAAFSLAATAALAQVLDPPRTWVSSTGDDTNDCTLFAPCRTFQTAHDQTRAGGEVNVLDPGSYGEVNITKAITLRADSVEAGVLISGGNAITINAGATDKVVIDGLDIEGLANGFSSNGIIIFSARDVVVRNTSIRGFNDASAGNGILVNGTTQISLTVDNSFIFNNRIGICVGSSGGNGAARVYNSNIVANSTAGIRVSGAGNRAEISGNEIVRTPKALEILNGGVIYSYGGNVGTPGDAPIAAPTF